MTRRLIYISFGAVVGVLAVRRASQVAQRYTPAGVSQRMTGAFGGLGETVREFVAELRLSMAEREHELRTGLGLDGTHDMVDVGR